MLGEHVPWRCIYFQRTVSDRERNTESERVCVGVVACLCVCVLVCAVPFPSIAFSRFCLCTAASFDCENDRCTDRQLQGKACSFVKHAQEEGEQVAVMHVHRTTPLRIVQVKDLSVLNRRDADEVHSDTPSEAESTQ